MERQGNFIKIPNEVILGEETIIKRYGIKSLLVYIYLEKHRTLRGDIYLSLANCIKECTFEQGKGAKGNNTQFKKILVGFKKENIITTDTDLEKIKINDLVKVNIQEVTDRFFILTDTEIDKIMKLANKSDKNNNILGVYAEIKARINRKVKGELDSRCTGHYEVSFPSYIQMCKDTNIKSFDSLHMYLEILKEMEMIYIGNNGGRVNKYTGEVKYDNNTYSLLEDDLEQSLKFFKQSNIEIGWEYKKIKDHRSLGGKKKQINKKIKDGTATEEDLKELEYINNILGADQYKTTKEEEVDRYLEEQEIDELL